MGSEAEPVNIQKEMDSFFGILDFCHQVALGGLTKDGVSESEAERTLAQLQKDRFMRRERPPFSRHFPNAGIWKGA